MNQFAELSAVIPTRNRPADLLRAVESVFLQTRLPDELLIVDQSDNNQSKDLVMNLYKAHVPKLNLHYIHDEKIPGLVAAKDFAIKKSRGDIIMFLEDDVVLTEDYIANLLRGFTENEQMLGSCGVVTQVPNGTRLYRWFFHFFHRGIFNDGRVGIHGNIKSLKERMIPCRFLSGGLSAYRRTVFDQVPFDIKNDFFMLEDIDFSTRAERIFGKGKFFINTTAHLDHRMSPVNRATLGSRYSRKFREYILFYKKNRGENRSLLSFLWLLIGLLLEAAFQSTKYRNLGPLRGATKGFFEGMLWKIR